MKESNSLVVYTIAALFSLHLAVFIALTVYQLDRITALENRIGYKNVRFHNLVKWMYRETCLKLR